MQKLLVGILFLSTSAMAAPIFCGAKQSPYRVEVSNNHRTAKVTLNGKAIQFGNLVCRSGRKLICNTPHTADAGFQATFTSRPGTFDMKVALDEFWFAGTRRKATLPCVQAMNRPM